MKMDWYQTTIEETITHHGTHVHHGLSASEAESRHLKHGPNVIADSETKSPWKLFFNQFTDFLVLVLLGAALIAGLLGEVGDVVAILVIVLMNAILGFVQEFRAEKAMQALKSLAAPHARVRREGQVLDLPAYALVPGDIVLLEAGNIVPADVRLLETHQLTLDESMLTGESLAVEKHTKTLPRQEAALGDQKNMAFKGTLITKGRGVGVVTSTGMKTELGKIAGLLKNEVEVKTPLQNQLKVLAKKLAFAVLILCLVLFLIGILRGENPLTMFLTALSLAVAAIPESLPAVVTVSLALGAKAMGNKNALIRKLPAVEALGSVTTICSDKTGTLTENKMRAMKFYCSGREKADLPSHQEEREHPGWHLLATAMAQNNDASLKANGQWLGDPTEIALAEAAQKAGFERHQLDHTNPRLAEIAFTSERSMMTTIHRIQSHELLPLPSFAENHPIVFLKGAPEFVLNVCQYSLGEKSHSGEFSIKPIDREFIRTEAKKMASEGLRVLAYAIKRLPMHESAINLAEVETDLIFLGLVGLMDPPRAEVKQAIHECHEAGIRVVMITGDHPITAAAIAKLLGISKEEHPRTITGIELGSMSEKEVEEAVRSVSIFARVAPEQKISIVKALQSQGEVCSMTGDGVNDAPALKRADIGVSMGKNGTDVAREASHLVLLDDNFATIVSAVKEGRRIYSNLRKFVRFALTGNSGEVWSLFLAPFCGLPTPLLPIHILWINLVTDGLPGIALALEPAEKDIMQRPPRKQSDHILSGGLWQKSLILGLATGLVTIGSILIAKHWLHVDQKHWQSMGFTVLTCAQLALVLSLRSDRRSLWSLGLFTNLPLLLVVLGTFVLQLGVLYLPWANKFLKTTPLNLPELFICFGLSFIVFFLAELWKFVASHKSRATINNHHAKL